MSRLSITFPFRSINQIRKSGFSGAKETLVYRSMATGGRCLDQEVQAITPHLVTCSASNKHDHRMAIHLTRGLANLYYLEQVIDLALGQTESGDHQRHRPGENVGSSLQLGAIEHSDSYLCHHCLEVRCSCLYIYLNQ
jgi:hypothetical protein